MGPRSVTLSAHDGLALHAEDWRPPADMPRRTPVLCLSGITRNGSDFRGLAERQSQRRRVVTFDYAGHGASARAEDPERYRPEAMIRDVLDMMAALHLHRAVVVGTSFGGLVSMALAVLRPGALAGVVLNDIGPEIGSDGHAWVLDFNRRDPAAATLEDCAALLRAHLPALPHLDDAGWLDLAGRTYAKGPDGRFHPRWDTKVIDQAVGAEVGPVPDLWALFGALGGLPLLLVWGEVSRLLLAPTVARMRTAHPGMRLLTLPGTGHAPTLTEPAAIAAIDAFIETIP
ncbi:alpha/beta hydrolase [Roseomonas hellenica]|uniref:Alpha/beta hydrolase n=1 Tax=Plastoroseomonas hellenica TaxID=2687306 RepID=A0ABS5F7N1_9PROT|nr:alpha/beta hydrolase [Plastoroseomonas hellenica]MBR0668552.1 alpha/beta hydrolase [Plastoroseomonas hellenica]